MLAEHDPAADRITVRMSSQMPSGARDTLAKDVLGIPAEKVRVLVGDVGGGFGMKTGLYPEDAVVAFAARQVGRPVKWAATRLEDFLSALHGRDTESRAELALDGDGRVLGLRVRTLANMGAYARNAGIAIQLLIGPWVSTSIYDIRTVDFAFTALLTNTAPTGPYRGAGRPEAIYIIERLMDAAAREIGLDPAELRRRNMIRPSQMPYTTRWARPTTAAASSRCWTRAWTGRLERLRRAGRGRGRPARSADAASPPSSNGPAATCSRSA